LVQQPLPELEAIGNVKEVVKMNAQHEQTKSEMIGKTLFVTLADLACEREAEVCRNMGVEPGSLFKALPADAKRYHVKCPTCGTWQISAVAGPWVDVEAWLKCRWLICGRLGCGERLSLEQWRDMLDLGEWRRVEDKT